MGVLFEKALYKFKRSENVFFDFQEKQMSCLVLTIPMMQTIVLKGTSPSQGFSQGEPSHSASHI